MRVFLASAGVDPRWSMVGDFRAAAGRDRVGAHGLVDDPDEADAVLFTEAHQLLHDPWLRTITGSPLYRRYRDRAFVHDERDAPWCRLPGLVTSYPRRRLHRRWQAAAPYLDARPDPLLVAAGARPAGVGAEPDLLFSFIGSRTHPVRDQVAALDHPRGLVELTGGAYLDPGSADYAQRRRWFAETVLRSRFVLCPRGSGTSSFRLFETMAAGRVPVIISDDWAAPAGPDWAGFALRWPQARVADLPARLERLEPQAAARGALARAAYERWYAADVVFHTLMELLAPLVRGGAGRTAPRLGVPDVELARVTVRLAKERVRGTVAARSSRGRR